MKGHLDPIHHRSGAAAAPGPPSDGTAVPTSRYWSPVANSSVLFTAPEILVCICNTWVYVTLKFSTDLI
eukprot:SAG31_NODE_162_length_21892_cov_343.171936_1_plen_69_part_00